MFPYVQHQGHTLLAGHVEADVSTFSYTSIYGFPLLERPGEKMILSHCEAAQVRGPGVLTTGWPVNDDDAATWRLDGGVCPGSSFAISQFSILEPSLSLEGIERPSLVL
mmetsp:Transcript_996/g.3007  ORF Transcript_996/g.3007 Transcript_996/m.3007 type:complete len:109 (+) Transcript_996:1468-1794(+)